MSFKDKLVGRKSSVDDKVNEEWISNEEEDEIDVDVDPLCPTIWVSKEEKRRLRRAWKFLLIIKLLRRTIGFKTL